MASRLLDRSFVRPFCAGILVLFAIGCAAVAPPRSIDGYDVRAMDSAPVEIDRYPSVTYRGRDAYLVDGRWWWPADDGWVVFEQEPVELHAARLHAEDGYPGAEQTPFARGGGPPVVQGPPQQPSTLGEETPTALRPR